MTMTAMQPVFQRSRILLSVVSARAGGPRGDIRSSANFHDGRWVQRPLHVQHLWGSDTGTLQGTVLLQIEFVQLWCDIGTETAYSSIFRKCSTQDRDPAGPSGLQPEVSARYPAGAGGERKMRQGTEIFIGSFGPTNGHF